MQWQACSFLTTSKVNSPTTCPGLYPQCNGRHADTCQREYNYVSYFLYELCVEYMSPRVFFFFGGGGGGASAPPPPPPLEDFVPPLGDPQKNCLRVNVLAFCSYLLQIPIRVILTCHVSFQIAPDAISEHLKFKIFWGEECSKVTGYYTPSSLSPPIKPKNFHFAPPLANFLKKNTDDL